MNRHGITWSQARALNAPKPQPLYLRDWLVLAVTIGAYWAVAWLEVAP